MVTREKEEDQEKSDCPLCERVANLLEEYLCKEFSDGDPIKESKCKKIAEELKKVEITVEEFIERMMKLGVKREDLKRRLKEGLENEKKGKAPKGKGHRRSV